MTTALADSDLSRAPEEVQAHVAALRSEVAQLRDRVAEQDRKLADQADRLRELRREAIRDPLTGLLNRRGFRRILDRTIDFVRRYDSSVAIVFIDLDSFKAVNDSFGHAAGDEVLRHVAQVVRATLRSSDVVGRIGGDEFVALLWKAEEAGARDTAGRVSEALAAKPALYEGREIPVSASVGVAMLSGADDIDTALDRADRDMYRVKEERRDDI